LKPQHEGAEVDEPRWLTEEQQGAWRRLAAVMLKLPTELDRQLQRDADMTHFEYWVVAMLSEAPGHRLQLKDLAGQSNSSPSRLSHVLRRLEERGWVVREPNPNDARASDALLTEAGWNQVAASAPGHVEAVQQLIFDGLTAKDVEDLARVCERIVARLDAPLPVRAGSGGRHDSGR
jgi:DNA-binding MarR family transcriptional regulator